MSRFLLLLLFSFSVISCRYVENNADAFNARQSEIPQAAYDTWNYVKKHNKAPEGYVGGRRFGNYENLLPKKGADNKPLRYKEWDIYPKKKGQNRGGERIVTSSDGKGYYTADHYNSFVLMN